MLELDLVLEPFVRQRYPELSTQQQALYRRLLECQDQELFDWFLKKREVPDTELRDMIRLILDYQLGRDLTR